MNSYKVRHVLFALGLTALLLAISLPLRAAGTNYYVNTNGSNGNSGTSADSPFETLQKALDVAQPGDTINLASGLYFQDAETKRNGSAESPITITGPANAEIRGSGDEGRVVQIFHDYYHLEGFTIDGYSGGDTSDINSYRDKLLYVHGQEPYDGVTGLKVTNMAFRNGGGECLRLRYFVTYAEISYNSFENCGVDDFHILNSGKNGEAIYMGTSSNQWGDGKNPTDDADRTSHNHVHHNIFDTQGNECVEVKEGGEFNLIEHNICTGNLDPDSAGFGARGDSNIFRYNTSYGNVGAGFRVGGHTIDGHTFGVNNDIYGNLIYGNAEGGIKFQETPQGRVCDNEMYDNGPRGNSAGSHGEDYEPDMPCEDGTSTPEPPTVTPSPSSTPEVTPSPTTTVSPTEEPTQEPTIVPTPVPTIGSDNNTLSCTGGVQFIETNIVALDASSYDTDEGAVPSNTLDEDLNTRWSAEGNGEWIRYDLATTYLVDVVEISFYQGDQRTQSFEIETSIDGNNWQEVFVGASSGTSTEFQTFDVTDELAKHVRIVGYGNTQNDWNSLMEVQICARTVPSSVTLVGSASTETRQLLNASGFAFMVLASITGYAVYAKREENA